MQPFENVTPADTDIPLDTVERTNMPESTNLQKPNDSRLDCDTHFDILYEPLSPNTDDILQALEEADSQPLPNETFQSHTHDAMGDLKEATNDQLGRVTRSKRLAMHNDSCTVCEWKF